MRRRDPVRPSSTPTAADLYMSNPMGSRFWRCSATVYAETVSILLTSQRPRCRLIGSWLSFR